MRRWVQGALWPPTERAFDVLRCCAGWLSPPGYLQPWVLRSLFGVCLVLLHVIIRKSEKSDSRLDEPVVVETVSEGRGTMRRSVFRTLHDVVISLGHFVCAIGVHILAASTLEG